MSVVLLAPGARARVEAYLLLRGVADPVARHELATAVLRSLEDEDGPEHRGPGFRGIERRGMVGAILAECRCEQRVALPAAEAAAMCDHELAFDVLTKRWQCWSAWLVTRPALALVVLIAVVLVAGA